MNWNEIEISNFYRNYFVDSVIRERCQNSNYILIYIFDEKSIFHKKDHACLSIGIYFSSDKEIKDNDYISYGHFDCYTRNPKDNDFEGIKAHKKIRDKMYKLKAKFKKMESKYFN
jgi:hypothetical protein